jgi:hypothetical protein
MVSQMLENEEATNLTLWQDMLDEEYAWAVVSYPALTAGEPECLEPVIVDGGELFYEGKF